MFSPVEYYVIRNLRWYWVENRYQIYSCLELYGLFFIAKKGWNYILRLFQLVAPHVDVYQPDFHVDIVESMQMLNDGIERIKISLISLMDDPGSGRRPTSGESDIPVTNAQLEELFNDFQVTVEMVLRDLCSLNTLEVPMLTENPAHSHEEEEEEEGFHSAQEDSVELREYPSTSSTSREDRKKSNKEDKQESSYALKATFTDLLKLALVDVGLARVQMQALEFKFRNALGIFEINAAVNTDWDLNLLYCQPEDEYLDAYPIIFLWKIPEFEKKFHDLTKSGITITTTESNFGTEGLLVKPTIKLNSDKNMIKIGLKFKNTSNVPFLHYRKFVLLDQRPRSKKDDIELIDRPSFKKNDAKYLLSSHFESNMICYVEELKDNSKYIKNDQVLLKIYLEPMAFIRKQFSTNDGTILWVIDNYAKRKHDEYLCRKQRLISQPFRINKDGYIIQLELFINGYEENDEVYISIGFKFILGYRDNKLKMPSRGLMAFYLMDQSESTPRNNFSMVREFGLPDLGLDEFHLDQLDEMDDLGIPNFILQSVAEGPTYLIEDQIVLKAKIEVH